RDRPRDRLREECRHRPEARIDAAAVAPGYDRGVRPHAMVAVFFAASAAHAACPAFAPPVNFRAGLDPRSVVIADLDRDGRLDLIVPNQDSNSISVLLGKPGATFADTADSFEAATTPLPPAVGDVNGDGK